MYLSVINVVKHVGHTYVYVQGMHLYVSFLLVPCLLIIVLCLWQEHLKTIDHKQLTP